MDVLFDNELFAQRIYEREQAILYLHRNEPRPFRKRLILAPLEKLTGTDQTRNYGRWKRGVMPRYKSTLFALCDVLDCDVDYLLGLQDVPRRSAQTVEDATGLNERSAYILTHIPNHLRKYLDLFLSDGKWIVELLESFRAYIQSEVETYLYDEGYTELPQGFEVDNLDAVYLYNAVSLLSDYMRELRRSKAARPLIMHYMEYRGAEWLDEFEQYLKEKHDV